VIAFEPSPVRYARLARNAALNRLDLSAYNVALSDKRGYRLLSVVDTGNSGHSSLTPWADVAYERAMPVWCDTGLDLIASGLPSPTIAKIDVEGHDLEVLRGFGAGLPSKLVAELERPALDYLGGLGFVIEQELSGANYVLSRT
jgi:FkbM family methyltransferase